MALGAEPRVVRRMILREGLAMIATGLVFGLVLGLAAGQACASMLYEVDPMDPVAWSLAAAALGLAAMLACWLPAIRATKVSPLTALRAE
jgi:ABC-type antimicrobial peptide transport system permease subunit